MDDNAWRRLLGNGNLTVDQLRGVDPELADTLLAFVKADAAPKIPLCHAICLGN